MEILQKIKWGIYNGIGFMLVVWISWVAYWAYVSISSDVTDWQTLTSWLFNNVLENQRSLKILVDNAAPAWFVWAFNLASCPTWWIPANGSNGTPDLRGEFIRWLDGGRWINSGRVLATYEAATKISTPLYYGTFGWTPSFAWLWFWDHDSFTQVNYWGSVITNLWSGAAWTWLSSTAWWEITIRPRNVALLYCVKQ